MRINKKFLLSFASFLSSKRPYKKKAIICHFQRHDVPKFSELLSFLMHHKKSSELSLIKKFAPSRLGKFSNPDYFSGVHCFGTMLKRTHGNGQFIKTYIPLFQ